MDQIQGADWETCLDLMNRWDVEDGSFLTGLTVIKYDGLLEPGVRTLWSDVQPGVWLTGRAACRSYQEAMSILGELCDALQLRYEGYRTEQAAIRGNARSYRVGKDVPFPIWRTKSDGDEPLCMVDFLENNLSIAEAQIAKSRVRQVGDAWLDGHDSPWDGLSSDDDSDDGGTPPAAPALKPKGPKGPGL